MLSTRQLITALRTYLATSANHNPAELADVAAVLVDVWHGVLDSTTAGSELAGYVDLIRALDFAEVQLDGARLTITYSLHMGAFQLRWHDHTAGEVRSLITLPYQPPTTAVPHIHAPYSLGAIGHADTVAQYLGSVTQLIQQGSALLNNVQFEAIYTIIAQEDWDAAIIETIYHQTTWLSRYDIAVAPDPTNPVRLIMNLVKATQQLEITIGAAKLLTLLRQLSNQAPSLTIGTQLQTWAAAFEQTFDARGVLLSTAPPDPVPQHLTILICLEPHRHTPDRYHIRGWTAVDQGEYIPVDIMPAPGVSSQQDEPTYNLHDLQPFLSHLLNTQLQPNIRRVGRKNVLIELLIPFSLFNEDLEQLNVDIDDEHGGERLGKHYPMVVRALDRLEGWAEKWLVDWEAHGPWFRQLEPNQPITPVAWLHTAHACAEHEAICDSLDDHHGMALAFPIQEFQEPLQYKSMCRAMLKRGIPVAVWSRVGTADPATIHAALTAILDYGAHVPLRIHQHRKAVNQAPCVYPLTILWDNPHHVPVL